MKRVHFDLAKGYPVGTNLWYRCKSCGIVIPSQPPECLGCSCGNIFIDVDYARVSVKNENDVELLES
jgi:hypothetical protein